MFAYGIEGFLVVLMRVFIKHTKHFIKGIAMIFVLLQFFHGILIQPPRIRLARVANFYTSVTVLVTQFAQIMRFGFFSLTDDQHFDVSRPRGGLTAK